MQVRCTSLAQRNPEAAARGFRACPFVPHATHTISAAANPSLAVCPRLNKQLAILHQVAGQHGPLVLAC